MKVNVIYFFLLILFSSCNYKPCEKVTDMDIVGVYISLNPKNKNKQYIETFADHTFCMVYCDEKNIAIKEWGKWSRFNGCQIIIHGIRHLNTGNDEYLAKRSAHFVWVRGKLAIGEDYWSFQKVRQKPKLMCEE